MTAKDDYAAIAVHTRYGGSEGQQCIDALAEIDSLRRWKSEALQVLRDWENVWIAAGCPGPLGSSKADSVRRLFERRQEVCGR